MISVVREWLELLQFFDPLTRVVEQVYSEIRQASFDPYDFKQIRFLLVIFAPTPVLLETRVVACCEFLGYDEYVASVGWQVVLYDDDCGTTNVKHLTRFNYNVRYDRTRRACWYCFPAL